MLKTVAFAEPRQMHGTYSAAFDSEALFGQSVITTYGGRYTARVHEAHTRAEHCAGGKKSHFPLRNTRNDDWMWISRHVLDESLKAVTRRSFLQVLVNHLRSLQAIRARTQTVDVLEECRKVVIEPDVAHRDWYPLVDGCKCECWSIVFYNANQRETLLRHAFERVSIKTPTLFLSYNTSSHYQREGHHASNTGRFGKTRHHSLRHSLQSAHFTSAVLTRAFLESKLSVTLHKRVICTPFSTNAQRSKQRERYESLLLSAGGIKAEPTVLRVSGATNSTLKCGFINQLTWEQLQLTFEWIEPNLLFQHNWTQNKVN